MSARPLVAFIFARGGSKGVPNKNIKMLAGKHLIGWSINQAKCVNLIDEVLVSTDSQEIADIAMQYGATIPFIRPSYLATDKASEWHAWQHALCSYKKMNGFYPRALVSVPTTAPLRSSDDIVSCIKLYEKGGYDVVLTGTIASHNPYFNMVKRNPSNFVELVNNMENNLSRRQDSPKVYNVTTVCYVASPDYVMKSQSIFSGRVGIVEIPQERALDIDSLYDFRIAEHLMRDRHG
jgi:CMP-N-acetylneuraminic acid synthetase